MRESEQFDDKNKIREVFENGSKEKVDLLLSFETDPEVAEETRRLITEVREELETNQHHIGAIIEQGVPGDGGDKVGKLPGLSRIEGNKD